MTVATAGVEIIPDRLHKAYRLAERPVTIEETRVDDRWSAYHVDGGQTLVIFERMDICPNRQFMVAALVRVLANLTHTCPTCSARVNLGTTEIDGHTVDGTMEHADACPVADAGLRDLRDIDEPLGDIPARPRFWTVWPPQLRPNYRPRRRMAA